MTASGNSSKSYKLSRVIQLLILGYVLLVVAVFIFQRSLIYIPAKVMRAQAEVIARENGFTHWLDATGEFIGWKTTGTGDTAVIVFHGNAGCAVQRDYLARPIHEATGMEVFVLEYPGYGFRPGKPGLDSILQSAESAIQSLPANRPLVIVSESIGAGPAAHVAKQFPSRIHGMVLFAPYDDLASVAQSAMPFLPARWLLRDRFRPTLWLSEVRAPAKFVMAGSDEVIPNARTQGVFECYAGRKSLLTIPGARHNDIPGQDADWWAGVFMELN
jgi:pimeloyl-ACP methyl ester carboxylesterase